MRKRGNEEISEDEGLFRGFPVEMLLYPTTRAAYGRMCRLPILIRLPLGFGQTVVLPTRALTLFNNTVDE